MKGSWFVVFVVVLLWAASPAAQAPQSDVAGTVTDESGAVLPGVTLTAVLGTTKETRTAVTASVGPFRFNSLPVGVYTVQAELSGFGTVKIENYKLSIGQ